MTVSDLITAVNNADSAQGLIDAVEDLVAHVDQTAMTTLVDVLKFNNPGAAVAAVDGLIQLGKPVVSYLLENLDGYNYGARAWMIRVFAGVGDPRALDLLVEAANTDFSLSVRRAATKGLGSILWQDIADENERFQWQRKVLDCLLLALEDGEWVVRYGAIAGLEGLVKSLSDERQREACDYLQKFITIEDEIVVRARCWQALRQLSLAYGLNVDLENLAIG
ncbi:PBS lyase HEAT domain protein repeat-containing protein [[Leptolyngbya] sp. PCC 7376]|uniref:HEAT repeat domain-containing protein n=1 Tax=[Leptolyngbya] sp. PCC 7376 TaxID=111781 RepID=UPI00029F2F3F|nr:HEAT repeat domain-containing protein [[Leptolyngbya] sp. PCC 7376]AFY38613.1 PBS lyase HEAT domain protein repeat-containing protein [[Leptolyngbya] sp. PCC 7376]